MSIDKNQLKSLIDRTLKEYEWLESEAATNLLLGTCAQESRFGTYIRQLGGGPALGIFQMERPTYKWLSSVYPEILEAGKFEALEWDIKAGILSARLRYRVDKHPLPDKDDIDGLAAYYKRVFNTYLGKATVEEFIKNYKKYVL